MDHGSQHQQSRSPPDGGLRAWIQVAGGFCIYMNTWGILNSFGIFQAYYQITILAQHSDSDISWIGSLQACLLFLVSAVSGPLYDLGYMHYLLQVGTALTVLGMMLASVSRVYWHFILTQGVLVGLGNGLLFLCALTNMGQYFTTKKGLANGIAATGGNVGGIIYPILFKRLIMVTDFGWTMRTIAFFMLAISAIPMIGMRQRVKGRERRELLRLAELKDVPFQLLNLGAFFGLMGVYVVFFYIQLFAEHVEQRTQGDRNITMSYLVAMLNAGGVFGRLLPNLIADKIGYLNMQTVCAICTVVTAFCWIPITTSSQVFAFSPAFAFVAGGFVTFGPSVVSLTRDISALGVRMGIDLFITGLGVLIGPPVAGVILKESKGSWLGLQLWCSLTVALAACCLAGARGLTAGWQLRSKA